MKLEVNAGVLNIFGAYQSDFNQGANRDSFYIYGLGTLRSHSAGIKICY